MARPYLTEKAMKDLREIKQYISRFDPQAARRLIQKIRSLTSTLSRQPLIGDLCDHVRPGLRCFSTGNYVIYYDPTEPRITILRVLHGARDETELE